uniref:Uncharacterized protein n=1 Tax=Macrostomum lignano TaxID=282301 RepID=A0A1I8G6Q6_9PLAT
MRESPSQSCTAP